MGIKKVFFAGVFVLQWFTGITQQANIFPLERKADEGLWRMEEFPGQVMKITFIPAVSAWRQQISNAVIAKPLATSKGAALVRMAPGNKSFTVDFAGTKIEMLGYYDSAGHRGFRFSLEADEKIMGAGERSVPLNRRGYKLPLYNNPAYGYSTNAESLNYSVPFIISSRGFAVFFDNPSKGYLDIGKSAGNILEYGGTAGQLDFYIIPGKNIDGIMQKYHHLTGTQPIPARWVFGNLMSRFGYRSQAQVMETVNKMQEDQFPVDAVILDLFWFGDSIKGTLGNLDWTNNKAWPGPATMIKDLQTRNIKTILITEPFVLQTTRNYEASKKWHATDSAGKPFVLTNFYFGDGGLLDIFRKQAQDWFWSKYKKQIALGVAGWWGDLGEPETHPENMYHDLSDLGFKKRFPANDVHNIYGHFWDKMLFDKYSKEYPATRLFNLNRSGYAGSPRYGVFPWSGDVSRSWEGLQAQLPLMIGMSLSGVPYIHADAGGFAGGDGDSELYTRWLQFATFTPVFRPHGTALGNLEPSVKNIPSEATFYEEPYKSIVRKTMQLRYRLLPYNYSLAYEQAKFGKPLVRPLFYYANSDSNLFKTDVQYMWGDALLISPVLKAGLKTLDLYLPAGNWYPLDNGNMIQGGKWIEEKLTLENIPVFVRAGSFIPTFESAEPVKNTGQYDGKKIHVRYYPSTATSSYTLYDDDGHNNNSLQKGDYELIRFEGNVNNKNIFIKLRPGNKRVMKSRELNITLPTGFEMAMAKVNRQQVSINGDKVKINYKGVPVDIAITLK